MDFDGGKSKNRLIIDNVSNLRESWWRTAHSCVARIFGSYSSIPFHLALS